MTVQERCRHSVARSRAQLADVERIVREDRAELRRRLGAGANTAEGSRIIRERIAVRHAA